MLLKIFERAITDGHPMVVRGRSGTSRDHWTTNRMVAKELQIFKQEVLKSQDPSQIDMIASGRITVISANQQKPGYINEKGHYTVMSQETEAEAKEYRAMLLEDNKFLDGINNPNFKEASVAVNVYGENNFYEDYYPMQRGQVTSRLRRRAAAMGMSPLAAINFLAGGVGQQPVAADAEVQALMEKVKPIQRLTNFYRESGSYNSRLNRGIRSVNGTMATAPTRFSQPMPPGVRGLASLVSSGEGSPTSMFPGENYPELLDMSIGEVVQFQKQKLADGRSSAAVGSYQFLYPEVAAQRAGLSMNDKFTPENQEKCLWQLC